VAERVREAWRFVLGSAGTDEEDFFFLGGHSVLAARLAYEVGVRAGVSVTFREVFRYPVLRDYIDHVRRAVG
jgi:hypothetical protein